MGDFGGDESSGTADRQACGNLGPGRKADLQWGGSPEDVPAEIGAGAKTMTGEKKREAVASAVQAAKSALDNALDSKPVSTGICPCGTRLLIDIQFRQATSEEGPGSIVHYKVKCPKCGLDLRWKAEL